MSYIEPVTNQKPDFDLGWKLLFTLSIVGLIILGISLWTVKVRANYDQNEDEQEVCWEEQFTPTPSPTEIPSTPTPTPVEVPPTLTPTPTEVPKEPDPWTCEVDHSCKQEATAPVCTDGTVLALAANVYVVRNGSDARVNWFRTGGNQANILYKENGQLGWTHALRDIQTNDFNSVDIHDLNPQIGYTFAVQQKTNCGGGETAGAVVVDPPANGKIFMYSYWEWL